jgi:hypothetical protein
MTKTLLNIIETISVVVVMLGVLAIGTMLLTLAITMLIAAVIIGGIEDIKKKSKEYP